MTRIPLFALLLLAGCEEDITQTTGGAETIAVQLDQTTSTRTWDIRVTASGSSDSGSAPMIASMRVTGLAEATEGAELDVTLQDDYEVLDLSEGDLPYDIEVEHEVTCGTDELQTGCSWDFVFETMLTGDGEILTDAQVVVSVEWTGSLIQSPELVIEASEQE